MFFILGCAIIFIILLYTLQDINLYWEKKGIKYIPPWPIVGNMGSFVLGRTSMFNLMRDLYESMNDRYFGIHQFTQPILVVKDIDLIKQICIKDFDHFVDHKNFFSESDEPVFHKNLFSSTGQKWRELRAILSPAFTGSKMRAMYMLMRECADRFTGHFASKCQKDEVMEFEMYDIYKRFTVDMIGSCAFGVECNSLDNEKDEFFMMGKDIGTFRGIRSMKSVGFFIMPKIMRFLKIRMYSAEEIGFFFDILTSTIGFREKNNVFRPDLVHLLMEAKKGKLKYEESGKIDDTGFATVAESDVGKYTSTGNLVIDDELIVAQALIFFIGGTDTTANLLSLVSHELAINTDIQKRLQNEIDQVMKECDGNVSYEKIMAMKYLDMVVSETLRVWPQAFFIDRLCTKDYTIEPTKPGEKPFVIEKGSILWIPVIGIHKDPQFYSNPNKFDPERFNDKNKGNINPYTYMPFGAGPRSCIGNRFALLVVKTLLCQFLYKFDIITTKKTQIPLQLKKSEIILNASTGYNLGFRKRS